MKDEAAASTELLEAERAAKFAAQVRGAWWGGVLGVGGVEEGGGVMKRRATLLVGWVEEA